MALPHRSGGEGVSGPSTIMILAECWTPQGGDARHQALPAEVAVAIRIVISPAQLGDQTAARVLRQAVRQSGASAARRTLVDAGDLGRGRRNRLGALTGDQP